MDDFTVVRRKGPKRSIEGDAPSEENIARLEAELLKKVGVIEKSALFREIAKHIDELEKLSAERRFAIDFIRCVALGSPSQEQAALFQLALIYSLAKRLRPQEISLFDPAFNQLDRAFLTEKLKYKVDEKDEYDSASRNVLHFLPHAPLSLTESIIVASKPRLFLANDVITHGDRMTKKELFEKYNTIALLSNVAKAEEKVEGESEKGLMKAYTGTQVDADGFDTVRRKNRRNRKGKIYSETVISYNYEKSYFKKCRLVRLQKEDGPWGNAFTDISLHVIE